jgi:hypothetical protein
MLAGDLDSVAGSECGKGILGSLVGDVDGTMGSGGISGGLRSVVFTVFLTKGGWVTYALSPSGSVCPQPEVISGWYTGRLKPSQIAWLGYISHLARPDDNYTLLECVYDLSIIGTSLP